MKLVEHIRDNLPGQLLLLDLKNLIYIDSSGVNALADLVRTCQKANVSLLVTGLSHQPLDIARRSGLINQIGDDHFYPDLPAGLVAADSLLS